MLRRPPKPRFVRGYRPSGVTLLRQVVIDRQLKQWTAFLSGSLADDAALALNSGWIPTSHYRWRSGVERVEPYRSL